jgi:tRNA-2-methylthio-N6-dimethylallyladenosine synthase
LEKELQGSSMQPGQDQQIPPRKVWFKTYGCQMNYHDSERMMYHLGNVNFTKAEKQEDADLLVFNTCSVRDLANQKFYSHVGETKKLKNAKTVKIAVAGCIAQTEGKELLKKYPQIDFAFGTDVIDNVAEMVFRSFSGEDRFNINTWDKTSDYSIETKVTHGQPQAFINIMKGCDKFCSYCIVPFTRGREKSRRSQEIKKDIERLVEFSGVQEITLLGQNVNSFGKENKESFSDLILSLEDIKGLELVRYTTSHPYDVTPDMIDIHRSAKKLAPPSASSSSIWIKYSFKKNAQTIQCGSLFRSSCGTSISQSTHGYNQ